MGPIAKKKEEKHCLRQPQRLNYACSEHQIVLCLHAESIKLLKFKTHLENNHVNIL